MRHSSDALQVAFLDDDQITEVLGDHAGDLEADWQFWARPDQKLPPPEDWPGSTAYLRGGRGSGKGFAGSHNFADLILGSDPGEWAVVAPTFGYTRDTCIESEESGLIKALGGRSSPSGVLLERGPHIGKWNRSMGHLELVNGSIVYVDGADDGALRIQGKNLRGAWCDEIGLWRMWETAWDESIGFAVRIDPAKIIATGTPKRSMPARILARRLTKDPTVINRSFATLDNAANLRPERVAELIEKYEGTRLGRQELHGEILEDGGGFFKRQWFTGNDDIEATDGPFVLREIPPGHDRRVRMWDLAATEPSDSNSDPDWTAGARVSYNPTSRLWLIEHVARFRKSPGARDETIQRIARGDGLHRIHVEQEPGASGKSVTEYLDRLLGEDARACQPYLPSGRKGVRAEILATASERGSRRVNPAIGPGVALLAGDWDHEAFLLELEDFDPDDEGAYAHDDQIDAVSAAMAVMPTSPPSKGDSPAGRKVAGGVQAPRGNRRLATRW